MRQHLISPNRHSLPRRPCGSHDFSSSFPLRISTTPVFLRRRAHRSANQPSRWPVVTYRMQLRISRIQLRRLRRRSMRRRGDSDRSRDRAGVLLAHFREVTPWLTPFAISARAATTPATPKPFARRSAARAHKCCRIPTRCSIRKSSRTRPGPRNAKPNGRRPVADSSLRILGFLP